jgi:mono/diheme cytochrome c family protein
MTPTLLGVALLCAATFTLGWLAVRAWRSGNRTTKWIGAIGAGVFALVLAAVSGASLRGTYLVYGPRGRPVQSITVERTPERVARGAHIARAYCAGCHSMNADLPLSGGKDIGKEVPIPIGSFPTANLTPAGRVSEWTDGDIFRAVREAVAPDGQHLLVMSAVRARTLSDEDLKSVIAYLRSQPTVGTRAPNEKLTLLGTIMAGAGMLPILPGLPPQSIAAVPEGATPEYGQYVAGWLGCDECHGSSLAGGGGGIMPKGPSLRSVLGWTEDGFVQTIRGGKTPFGKQLDSLMMPYNMYKRLSDTELKAIYAYLRTLPAPKG